MSWCNRSGKDYGTPDIYRNLLVYVVHWQKSLLELLIPYDPSFPYVRGWSVGWLTIGLLWFLKESNHSLKRCIPNSAPGLLILHGFLNILYLWVIADASLVTPLPVPQHLLGLDPGNLEHVGVGVGEGVEHQGTEIRIYFKGQLSSHVIKCCYSLSIKCWFKRGFPTLITVDDKII